MEHPPTLKHALTHPQRLSRRAVIGAITAVGLTGGTAASAASRTPSPLTTAYAPVTPARDLAAVRVFPSYTSKAYGQHDAVLARLGSLGVKRISHKFSPAIAGSAAVISFTQRAYTLYGIKSWLTMGEPRKLLSAAEWDKMVAALKGPLAGMVDRVYGWNEPNHVRGTGVLPADWHVTTAAHQAELWRRVSPLGIKVGTPQLWSGDFAVHDADLMKLAPGIRGSFDHIGWHLYPRGTVGVDLIDRFQATYQRALGTYPVVCTEAGYSTAPNYTGGAKNLTEAEQATLVPQLLAAYVSRGYGLSVFELLDDPDPTGANREAHLGLVGCGSVTPTTWKDKPAFGALQAKLATL